MLIVTLAVFEKPILIYYIPTVYFLPLAILAKVSPYIHTCARILFSKGDRDIVYVIKKKKKNTFFPPGISLKQ